MPFTLSHPAAVLPLFRFVSHPIFVLALIIGSVTPDFGYYLRVFSIATFAHTFFGSVIVCIPAGLLLMGGLLIMRKPLLWLMPTRIRSVFNAALTLPPRSRFLLMLQIAFWIWVGALTHNLWDSFTHRSGWFVERFEFFQSSIVIWEGHSFPVYYILQQASTLIGFLIVMVAAMRVCSRFSPEISQRRGDLLRYCFWMALVAVSILFSVPFAIQYASRFEGLLQFRSFVFQLGILSGAIFAALTLTSLMIVSLKAEK